MYKKRCIDQCLIDFVTISNKKKYKKLLHSIWLSRLLLPIHDRLFIWICIKFRRLYTLFVVSVYRKTCVWSGMGRTPVLWTELYFLTKLSLTNTLTLEPGPRFLNYVLFFYILEETFSLLFYNLTIRTINK